MVWINGIIVLILTLLFGKFGLPYIRSLHLGQTVRSDGPETHFKKSGTSTFGGLFFLAALLVSVIILLLVKPEWHSYFMIIILMLFFGIVGFIDDYIKVKVDTNGLSVKNNCFNRHLYFVQYLVFMVF